MRIPPLRHVVARVLVMVLALGAGLSVSEVLGRTSLPFLPVFLLAAGAVIVVVVFVSPWIEGLLGINERDATSS